MSNRQALQVQRIEFQKRMVEMDVWCSCLNCEHWEELTVVQPAGCKTVKLGCELAGGAVPPPEILVHGCPAWEYDIPF